MGFSPESLDHVHDVYGVQAGENLGGRNVTLTVLHCTALIDPHKTYGTVNIDECQPHLSVAGNLSNADDRSHQSFDKSILGCELVHVCDPTTASTRIASRRSNDCGGCVPSPPKGNTGVYLYRVEVCCCCGLLTPCGVAHDIHRCYP